MEGSWGQGSHEQAQGRSLEYSVKPLREDVVLQVVTYTCPLICCQAPLEHCVGGLNRYRWGDLGCA